MKEIKLTQGKVAFIDDDDYKLMNQYKWCAHSNRNGNFYAERKFKNKIIKMHRLIMNPQDNKEIHHKDGNGLNNQRNNLRIVTRSQHRMTMNDNKNTSSKHKGVNWFKGQQKWQARIQINGKRKFLGYFETEEEAAKAYNAAAQKYFGDIARLNFIKW